MKTTDSYTKTAQQFANKYNVKLTILDSEFRKYFLEDKEPRYVFKCKLSRGKKSYTFNFGQSIAAGGEEPNIYDILACLTKHDPESFEFFCSNYGYNTDSRAAEKIYKAVVKEYNAVNRLFGDIIEELEEIN